MAPSTPDRICQDCPNRATGPKRWLVAARGLRIGALLASLPLALALALALPGCRPASDNSTDPTSTTSMQATALRLLVVGDDAMAVAAEQLRGEWEGQTGSTLQVVRVSKLAAGDSLPQADAVVMPGQSLPLLATAGVLDAFLEIPKNLIDDSSVGEAKPREGDPPKPRKSWSGIYSALKLREAVWGTKTIAVPFGSPTLVCYYRTDLLERIGAKPPKTWADYRKLVEQLADRTRLGAAAAKADKPWSGTCEPLGVGWAGWTLIARAAPYATHRSQYSVLFRIDSMEPLIDGPPFVRALTELVDAAKFGSADALKTDPAAARRAFWEGKCAVALTWPTAADKFALPDGESPATGICELPGSADVYNVESKTWETRREGEDPRVTVLGMAGRLGVVPADAKSPIAGARLLLWLADDPWNRQIGPVSSACTMFRASDEKSARAWVERPMTAKGAVDYATVARNNFMRPQVLVAMRVPGRDEFLTVLDQAVQQAVAGKQSPTEALATAAARWRQTRDSIGVDRLRNAYLKGLGL